MKTRINQASYVVLIIVGWAGSVAGWGMISGQEELTRWTTHDITNGTAMFFAVALGFLALCLFIASRQKKKKARLAWMLTGQVGAVALMGAMSAATPFGL